MDGGAPSGGEEPKVKRQRLAEDEVDTEGRGGNDAEENDQDEQEARIGGGGADEQVAGGPRGLDEESGENKAFIFESVIERYYTRHFLTGMPPPSVPLHPPPVSRLWPR